MYHNTTYIVNSGSGIPTDTSQITPDDMRKIEDEEMMDRMYEWRDGDTYKCKSAPSNEDPNTNHWWILGFDNNKPMWTRYEEEWMEPFEEALTNVDEATEQKPAYKSLKLAFEECAKGVDKDYAAKEERDRIATEKAEAERKARQKQEDEARERKRIETERLSKLALLDEWEACTVNAPIDMRFTCNKGAITDKRFMCVFNMQAGEDADVNKAHILKMIERMVDTEKAGDTSRSPVLDSLRKAFDRCVPFKH